MRRKVFTGIGVGLVKLTFDKTISDNKVNAPLAFKLYGLYPIVMGGNRHVFAKFGFDYFSYSNDYFKKSIPSGSFGLRYSAISGFIRPYLESSIGIGLPILNNRPQQPSFPLFVETGVNIPVNGTFINVGLTVTPVVGWQSAGYNLIAFNLGLIF